MLVRMRDTLLPLLEKCQCAGEVTVKDSHVERRVPFVVCGFQRRLLGEKVVHDH